MAAAAYQSGEKLHSQFTGTWEYGRETERIDHTGFCFPRTPHANMPTGRRCGMPWTLLRPVRTHKLPAG